MDANIQSRFVKVNDTTIHYLSAGEGETILLLHGWPTSAYLWRGIISELSDKYRVIAPDLPGFGQSDKRLEDSYSFRYYQRIIDGFLVQLEIESVSLGVHDLGGPLGLYWMVRNMDKANRLLLFNTLVYPDFSWGVKLFMIGARMPGVKHWLTSPKGIKRAIYFGVHQKDAVSAMTKLGYH